MTNKNTKCRAASYIDIHFPVVKLHPPKIQNEILMN